MPNEEAIAHYRGQILYRLAHNDYELRESEMEVDSLDYSSFSPKKFTTALRGVGIDRAKVKGKLRWNDSHILFFQVPNDDTMMFAVESAFLKAVGNVKNNKTKLQKILQSCSSMSAKDRQKAITGERDKKKERADESSDSDKKKQRDKKSSDSDKDKEPDKESSDSDSEEPPSPASSTATDNTGIGEYGITGYTPEPPDDSKPIFARRVYPGGDYIRGIVRSNSTKAFEITKIYGCSKKIIAPKHGHAMGPNADKSFVEQVHNNTERDFSSFKPIGCTGVWRGVPGPEGIMWIYVIVKIEDEDERDKLKELRRNNGYAYDGPLICPFSDYNKYVVKNNEAQIRVLIGLLRKTEFAKTTLRKNKYDVTLRLQPKRKSRATVPRSPAWKKEHELYQKQTNAKLNDLQRKVEKLEDEFTSVKEAVIGSEKKQDQRYKTMMKMLSKMASGKKQATSTALSDSD